MNLHEATTAVDTVRETGADIFGYNSDKWFDAEDVLTENGDTERAKTAHYLAMRAYRNEEWHAGLN